MKYLKSILEWTYSICAIVCPISFILIWVGLLSFDAKMTVYSFVSTAVTGLFVFYYGTSNNDNFRGRG